MATMDDAAHYEGFYKEMCVNRKFLTQGFLDAGFKPATPSQTNFLFIDMSPVSQQVVVDTYFTAGLHIFGAYIKPFHNYVRIAIGTMEQCRQVIEVAQSLSKQYGKA